MRLARPKPGSCVAISQSWPFLLSPSPLPFSTLFFSFLFFLACSILSIPVLRCTEIVQWSPISTHEMIQKNPGGIFNGPDRNYRHPVRLDELPLFDADGQEILVYNSVGRRILRRVPSIDENAPSCGVLVDLSNIQALFNPYSSFNHPNSSTISSDLADAEFVCVHAYPHAFLRSVGNIQADGVSYCFYPIIIEINKSGLGWRTNEPERSKGE